MAVKPETKEKDMIFVINKQAEKLLIETVRECYRRDLIDWLKTKFFDSDENDWMFHIGYNQAIYDVIKRYEDD